MSLKALPEMPRPDRGEVLVRMILAPVNPADRLTIAGAYTPAEALPETLGAEGMGVVVRTGARVGGITEGNRVILLSRGNWASWRLVRADELMVVPEGLTDEQAAMLRINPATALRLVDRLALRPGDWLVQNAAGSSVARWVRLVAARRGLRVLDVRRPRPGGGEEGLADGADLAERVVAATRDAPIRGALDAVAGQASGRLASCLSSGGQMVVFGHLSGRPCAIPSTLLTTRMLRVSGFSLRPAEQEDAPERKSEMYHALAGIAMESPEPIAARIGLREVDEALRAAAAAGRNGRILLDLDR